MNRIKQPHLSISQHLVRAVMVGLMSTAAMTVVMQWLYNALPRREQYPLPPEEITVVAEAKVFGRFLDEPQHMALTLFSHFGYGTVLGMVYSLVAEKIPFMPLLSGLLYGIFVWAGSYLGWLPAFRVLRPVSEFTPSRRSLLIISHLVWGGALGILTGYRRNVVSSLKDTRYRLTLP
jgi:uncharacterized membrane protein YagU involved in acid resistance